MKISGRVFLISCCALMFACTTTAFAQGAGTAITAVTAIDSLVSQIKTGLEEIINQTETAYSRQAFDTRTHAIVVLQQVDTVASDIVGKAFRDANDTQKRFFVQATALLDKWNKGNHDILKELDNVSNTMEEAVSRLPSADKTPLIKAYYPSFLVPTLSGPTFSLSISGTRIGTGDPSLQFGKVRCERFSKTDRQIQFRCPASVFGTPARLRGESGILEIEAPQGFWDVVLFQHHMMKYDIGVVAVPSELGRYNVVAVVPQSKIETQDRKYELDYTNPHCSGAHDIAVPQNASEGWKIVETSVQVTPTSVSSGCSGPSVDGVSSTGFLVTGKAVNSGNCVTVHVPFDGSQTISYDGRGWVKGIITWKEQRTTVKDGTVDVARGSLSWGSDVAIQLPPDAKGFVVTVLRIDGTQQVAVGAGNFDRYSVRYAGADTHTVVISPKSVNEAFGT
jgi:hypothetical protein